VRDKSRKAFIKGIYEYADQLKLSAFKTDLESELSEASAADLTYEELIYVLLQKESDYRQEQIRKSRIRLASFPYKKYLEDLDLKELPEDGQKKLNILSTLEFIKNGQNVILSGNSGTGKTHIAIGIGIKACFQGYKVFFTTVPLFIT